MKQITSCNSHPNNECSVHPFCQSFKLPFTNGILLIFCCYVLLPNDWNMSYFKCNISMSYYTYSMQMSKYWKKTMILLFLDIAVISLPVYCHLSGASSICLAYLECDQRYSSKRKIPYDTILERSQDFVSNRCLTHSYQILCASYNGMWCKIGIITTIVVGSTQAYFLAFFMTNCREYLEICSNQYSHGFNLIQGL